jgi:hypothetical protein
MTREQKIEKRKTRALRRAKKHNEEWKNLCTRASWKDCPPAALKHRGYAWADPNSPTGYSQVCSYDVFGTCQSPCNGDC